MKIVLIVVGSLVGLLILGGMAVGFLYVSKERRKAVVAFESERARQAESLAEVEELEAALEAKSDELTDARTRSTALSAELEELKQRLATTTAERDRARSDLAEAEERAREAVAARQKVERELKKLRSLLETGKTVERIDDVHIIEAKVTAVNQEHNVVLLSVGRDDGVKVGFRFTVYRGNDYVASLVIDYVGKDKCTGYSKKALEQTPIRVGDNATTRF